VAVAVRRSIVVVDVIGAVQVGGVQESPHITSIYTMVVLIRV
jgi:hypothetical protein